MSFTVSFLILCIFTNAKYVSLESINLKGFKVWDYKRLPPRSKAALNEYYYYDLTAQKLAVVQFLHHVCV